MKFTRPQPETTDLWLTIVNKLEETIPTIAYFPTFLVDMPAQIMLKEHEGESALNRYYREVIEDVLQLLTPRLSLQTHVIDRIQAFQAKETSPYWFSIFSSAPTKSNIDAVFQKLSNALTKEVLGSWSKVFNRPSGAKSIIAEWNVDTQKQNMPYVTFSVSDGKSRYNMSERSLGVRWFFSFLLFTVIKNNSTQKTIFLFDEPAANLHARAQAELLGNFAKIASGSNRIVYSTHSHHMINPRWLSLAYIVDNKAIDYDYQQGFSLDARPTDINAIGYRQFASQYPTRTSYFQLVIEQLEYVSPLMLGQAPFVIFEGISDYYAFKYVQDFTGDSIAGLALMPGAGAGASGPIISYLLGRAEKFLVLLDDDKAGRTAAERYRNEWMLTGREVSTLSDINQHLRVKDWRD